VKLVYTDEAIEDLIRLRAFIAVNNPLAAARIAIELVGKIELLPDFPKMAHKWKWHRYLIPFEI
jgi:plasmid stabilization system protein ParE